MRTMNKILRKCGLMKIDNAILMSTLLNKYWNEHIFNEQDPTADEQKRKAFLIDANSWWETSFKKVIESDYDAPIIQE